MTRIAFAAELAMEAISIGSFVTVLLLGCALLTGCGQPCPGARETMQCDASGKCSCQFNVP